MPNPENVNQRFNTLWEEIGAKQITLGTKQEGITVTIDADLSIFSILEKLKEKSRDRVHYGDLAEKDYIHLKKNTHAIKQLFNNKLWQRIDDHFDPDHTKN